MRKIGKVRGADIYWFVIQNTWLGSSFEHGWGNGYVVLHKSHPLFGYDPNNWEDVNDLVVPYHPNGGFTWGSFNDGSLRVPEAIKKLGRDYWILGFDTNHSWDDLGRWPMERVIRETRQMAQAFK